MQHVHIVPTTVNADCPHCLLCAANSLGQAKQNNVGRFINNEVAHDATVGHRRRVQEGRFALPHVTQFARTPGDHYTIPMYNRRTTYRCVVCSLTQAGAPRPQFNQMEFSSVAPHVNSVGHVKRVNDGRYQAFVQRGQAWVLP